MIHFVFTSTYMNFHLILNPALGFPRVALSGSTGTQQYTVRVTVTLDYFPIFLI